MFCLPGIYFTILICKVTEVKIYVNFYKTVKFWLIVMHMYHMITEYTRFELQL